MWASWMMKCGVNIGPSHTLNIMSFKELRNNKKSMIFGECNNLRGPVNDIYI